MPIRPVWLCPLRLRDGGPAARSGAVDERPPWPLYPLAPGQTYVNVGFWSTVPIAPGATDGDVNRSIEQAVADHAGHKSLYSDAFYDEDYFGRSTAARPTGRSRRGTTRMPGCWICMRRR